MTPEQFVTKWQAVELSERSAAQQHFIDLCNLLGEPTPAEADPTGTTFTFEKGGTTATGGHGWADVWKRGNFAWEYKAPGKDLQAAYYQLKKYADALENPPLLITSDLKRIEIHTNFTNTVKVVHVLQLADLKDHGKLELLRSAFSNPEKLRPGVTRQMVTKNAAERFSELAHHLQAKGFPPQAVAHFLNRLIFCMFAEDIGLLPSRIFSKLIAASVAHPDAFEANAKQLFAGMAKGGAVAFEVIEWFNGGLFDDDSTLPLDKKELELLLECTDLDWSSIEPSIFGTLFERGLDPDKRSQQGTHYTDPETILKIINPVLLDPWQQEWNTEKLALEKLIDRAKKTISEAARRRYHSFLERLANYRVLDPACGSGNFLYLSLRGLKAFEKRVIHEAEALGLPPQFPHVGPEAVMGIEVNPYAAELARVTIWIGEIQWMVENGFNVSRQPILKPLDQIECRDAILDDKGTVPTWPRADAIVGNPPFLGSQFMLRGLGDDYVGRLRKAYAGKLTAGVDLCAYWLLNSASAIEEKRVARVGLVATQSIRKGKNRQVLQQVCQRARLFAAWSDEPWVNEGAAVRVSIVCFAATDETLPITLNGARVTSILPDLTARTEGLNVDLTQTTPLMENQGVTFQGTLKVGAFDVPGEVARGWLQAAGNANGRPNSDVVRPWRNGQDVTKRPSDTWIVDFGVDRTEAEASLYTAPYEYLAAAVRTSREQLREKKASERWWIHQRPRPELRKAVEGLSRCIITPRVSKHRLFVWMDTRILPDSRLLVVAVDDDVTFGILQSHIHECWSLANASMHGVGNDPTYAAGPCFESFPFPEGLSPHVPPLSKINDPRGAQIAASAQRLNKLREEWLNPSEFVDRVPEVVPCFPDRVVAKNTSAATELSKRTLTNLYNLNPPWLQSVHQELNEAVAAAYTWEWPLQDDEILKRVFTLNKQRAGPMFAREVQEGVGEQGLEKKVLGHARRKKLTSRDD